jgi:hypothetical protein
VIIVEILTLLLFTQLFVGTLLCFIFFVYSGEARFEWRRYICGVKIQNDKFEDDEYSRIRNSDNYENNTTEELISNVEYDNVEYDSGEYVINGDSGSYRDSDVDIDTCELNNSLLT